MYFLFSSFTQNAYDNRCISLPVASLKYPPPSVFCFVRVSSFLSCTRYVKRYFTCFCFAVPFLTATALYASRFADCFSTNLFLVYCNAFLSCFLTLLLCREPNGAQVLVRKPVNLRHVREGVVQLRVHGGLGQHLRRRLLVQPVHHLRRWRGRWYG